MGVGTRLRKPELGVKREEQWDLYGIVRILLVLDAMEDPGAAEIADRIEALRSRIIGNMVQIEAKGALAERRVVAGIENELVPRDIDGLGWHAEHCTLGVEAEHEEIPQAPQNVFELPIADAGKPFGELGAQAEWKRVMPDEAFDLR